MNPANRDSQPSTVRYVLLAEDVALRTFVEGFLRHKEQNHQGLIFTNAFRDIGVAGGETKFENALRTTIEDAFLLHDAHIFIGTRDTDKSDWKKLSTRFVSSIPDRWKNRCAFALPVKCIETWLRIMKESVSGSNLSQNTLKQYIKEPCKTHQREVYGKPKTTEIQRAYITKSITGKSDFNALRTNQTDSFLAFEKAFDTAINAIRPQSTTGG